MPILDKNNKKMVKKYYNFLRNSPYADLHQDFGWGKVKSDNWIDEYVYIEENDKITAGMLILIRTFGKIFTMMYCPRGPVCDLNDIELVNKLINEAKPLIKEYKPFVLKMDPRVPYSEILKKKYSKEYRVTSEFKNIFELMQPIRSMILKINGESEEEILKRYSQKTRYNIHLAERKGITVRYSRDEKDLQTFYKLSQITAQRDGIALRTYDHFKSLLNSYDENTLRIYLAEYEGEALSAAITLNFAGVTTYLYGASSNQKRNLMPNYIMQQHMIRWAIETGCREYDFGGIFNTTIDNGLFKFKAGFCKQEGPTKFIGEIDKIYNPIYYFIFTKLITIVKDINIRFRKK